MNKVWKKLAAGLLGATMIAATGCSAVGGVDVSKALVNNISVKSSEKSLNLSFEFLPSASITAEQKTALSMIQNMKVNIPSIKMQDAQHISYQGDLTVGRGTIPFQLYINGDQLIAKIEGSKKPIVLDLNGAISKSLNMDANSIVSMITGPIVQKSGDVLPLLASYAVAKVPNPASIQVSPVTEKIHGESLSLQQLHTEIKGSEALTMTTSLLSSMASDEEGMRALLGSIYDVVAPTLKESLKASGANSLIVSLIDNKNLTINFIYPVLKDYLEKTSEKLTSTSQSGSGLYSDKAYVNTDLYLDSDLLARKTTIEVMLPYSDGNGNSNGLSGIKVKASGESWNLNKPVTADPITVSGDKLLIGGADSSKLLNASKLVNNFDKQSIAFKMLMEDMMLTRKRISLIMGENAGQDPGDSGKPFIKEGFTLVPARYVAENLDADIKWDANLRQVTIIDALSGTQIVLTIDSDVALVNGKNVTLESKAMITGGSTYVPVRFISENLGAKVGWDNNTRTVSISRD
jgi:hypothetical protein